MIFARTASILASTSAFVACSSASSCCKSSVTLVEAVLLPPFPPLLPQLCQHDTLVAGGLLAPQLRLVLLGSARIDGGVVGGGGGCGRGGNWSSTLVFAEHMASFSWRHSPMRACVGKQLHACWPFSVKRKSWKQHGHIQVSRCVPKGIQTLHLIHAPCVFLEVE